MARLDPSRAPISGRFTDAVTLGSWRRRRRMAKLLAELDRRDRDAALRLPPKSKPTTHRLGSLLVALLLLAAAGGVVYVARHHGSHTSAAATSHSSAIGDDTATSAETVQHLNGFVPSPGVGEHKSRILPATTAPAGSGGYKLFATPSGQLERYDPCRPIHYVIRDENTPPGADLLVQQAVAAVSKATGLQFINDGSTTEKPALNRKAYQPSRYGDRWAPVLIAWTTPTEIPKLQGAVAGWGGSESFALSAHDAPAFVTGIAYLDTAQLTQMQSEPHGNVFVRAVIEHELGHVVGLNHVTDPAQLMYPVGRGQTGYGAGDLRGLAIAGSGACHPEL